MSLDTPVNVTRRSSKLFSAEPDLRIPFLENESESETGDSRRDVVGGTTIKNGQFRSPYVRSKISVLPERCFRPAKIVHLGRNDPTKGTTIFCVR